MNMPKEKHPYLHQFVATTRWKNLIIGTFPPNKQIREGKKSLTDYFYGNRGSLWKILGNIYTEFDFSNGTRDNLTKEMMAWQTKYNIGITDTLKTVSRKNISSADDADFILDYEDYNHELKTYVLANNEFIEKIIFTSSKGCNSAFGTFKVIMGNELGSIRARMVINLPSPSSSSNTAWFNVNTEDTLGLHPDLFKFITTKKETQIAFFGQRWELKKIKKATKSKNKLPSAPKGLINEFKVWSYKKEFPEKIY